MATRTTAAERRKRHKKSRKTNKNRKSRKYNNLNSFLSGTAAVRGNSAGRCGSKRRKAFRLDIA